MVIANLTDITLGQEYILYFLRIKSLLFIFIHQTALLNLLIYSDPTPNIFIALKIYHSQVKLHLKEKINLQLFFHIFIVPSHIKSYLKKKKKKKHESLTLICIFFFNFLPPLSVQTVNTAENRSIYERLCLPSRKKKE